VAVGEYASVGVGVGIGVEETIVGGIFVAVETACAWQAVKIRRSNKENIEKGYLNTKFTKENTRDRFREIAPAMIWPIYPGYW